MHAKLVLQHCCHENAFAARRPAWYNTRMHYAQVQTHGLAKESILDPFGSDDPNTELERLAEEQLNDLESDLDDRRRRGKTRRERVLDLYNQGAVQSPDDHFHASLVMLYGEDVAHFELSKTFARRAAALGHPKAWTLIAAAWDRSLIARGKPQRYGTQFVREHGRWSLGAIDERVTDAERAFYGVPPLWVQQQSVDRLQRREDEPF